MICCNAIFENNRSKWCNKTSLRDITIPQSTKPPQTTLRCEESLLFSMYLDRQSCVRRMWLSVNNSILITREYRFHNVLRSWKSLVNNSPLTKQNRYSRRAIYHYICKAGSGPKNSQKMVNDAERGIMGFHLYAGMLPGWAFGFNQHGLVFTINALNPSQPGLQRTGGWNLT